MRYFAVALLLFGLLATSCKTVQNETSATKDTPAANMDRIIRCEVGDWGSAGKTATFRGKPIQYFNSNEIDYSSPSFFSDKNARHMSFAGLDFSLMGTAGYESNSNTRGAVDSSGRAVPNVRVVVVDVRMIGGVPHYHYFSNETAYNPMENWSSTKALVMFNAAETIRNASGGRVGLYSKIRGRARYNSAIRDYWVADHVTEVTNTSHNATAVWFKSITGASGSDQFVKNWLTNGDSGQSFGGGHGASPQPLGNVFRNGSNESQTVTISRAGSWSGISSNTLKTITMAEFWKRLAVNRLDDVTWRSAVQDEDLAVLKYGYVNSQSVGGFFKGAAGTSQRGVFVSAFGGKSRLDQISGGRWRLFGKTGSGSSGIRNRNESVFGGYFCLPATSASPKGRLFAWFINAQTPGGDKTTIRRKALTGIADVFAPEIRNAANLFGTGEPPPAITQITANFNTVLKISQAQSSTLAENTEKCPMPPGTYRTKSVERVPGSQNYFVKLDQSLGASCQLNEGYVYIPHFENLGI
ncbi:MAG: hypothetical protein HRU19_16205 [Pseudobacteriovorax sp.]|nr:hypothetical protein [Pseudobacteriovorax sp.]